MCKESIIEKVKALLNKTVSNGATMEEELAAVQMAQKLLLKNNLSMKDVEVSNDEPYSQSEVELNSKGISLFDSRLANIVARHFACAPVLKSKIVNHSLRTCVLFLGDAENVETVSVLYQYLRKCFDSHWTDYHKTLDDSAKKRLLRNSYLIGFTNAIDDALTDNENKFALVPVVPQKVTDYINTLHKSSCKNFKLQHNADAAMAGAVGYSDGREAYASKNKRVG